MSGLPIQTTGLNIDNDNDVDNDMMERDKYYNATGRYAVSIGDAVHNCIVVWKSDNERKSRDMKIDDKDIRTNTSE